MTDQRTIDRIDRAIDELLEEGYLIPTIGADGEVTLHLSDKFKEERCKSEIELGELGKFGKVEGLTWQLRCGSIDPNPDHVHAATIRWLTKGS